MYRNKTFQCNGYGHKNWASDCNLCKWVQYVRKKNDVNIRCKMKMFPETFQDATKELKKKDVQSWITTIQEIWIWTWVISLGRLYSMIQKNISVNIIFTFVSAIENIISDTYHIYT